MKKILSVFLLVFSVLVFSACSNDSNQKEISFEWNPKSSSIEEFVPFQYEKGYSFSEGLAKVQKNNKLGYVDKDGKEVIPCIYETEKLFTSYGFSEGLTITAENGKYGYINNEGEKVIPFVYDLT